MQDIISKIATAIEKTEFAGKSYLVGGYVRDLIMGINSNDLDIVVALDQGGIRLAQLLYDKGISSRPVIFKNFGTAFVLIGDYKVEFVMTRQESYRGGNRKPSVKAGSLEDDVYRRDFTINSLLMDILSREIIDITGNGKNDIRDKVIRATADVDVLFREDPLRMLRAIRFANQLRFTIEGETLKGIEENSERLSDISWERRRDEFSRIITSDTPVKGLRLLIELGLMNNLIPELLKMQGLEQNCYHHLDVLEHTFAAMEQTESNLCLRLAVLLHDIAKPVVKSDDGTGIHFYQHEKKGAVMSGVILRRFRFPLQLANRVSRLISNHMRLKNSGLHGEKISDKGLRRLYLEMGDDMDLLLQLIAADNSAHAEEYRLPDQIPEITKRIDDIKIYLTKPEMPLKGRDIISELGLKPGREIGDLLKQAREIWLGHPQYDKRAILKRLKKFREEDMADQESKVTKTVREGMNKALEVGEDVIQALGRITKEIVHTAKEEDLSTKEKVQKLANEALEGAKEGVKSAQPQTEEFVKKASKSIVESIKVAAPKVSHFAQEALKGMYEGAKDFYDQRKEGKKVGTDKPEKPEDE